MNGCKSRCNRNRHSMLAGIAREMLSNAYYTHARISLYWNVREGLVRKTAVMNTKIQCADSSGYVYETDV